MNISKTLLIGLTCLLFACTSDVKQTSLNKIIYKPKDIYAIEKTKKDDNNFIRDFFNIKKVKNKKDSKTEIDFLWIATIDTLSALIPIEDIDDKNRLITTEWQRSKKKPSERYKIAAIVSSKQFKKSSLQLKLYRQVKDQDGWLYNNVRKEKNRIEQGNKDIDLKEGTLENGYDHSNCHDCSCVPELTLDCVQHLIKLSTQSMQMTQRLQSIVELREQIKDLWGNQIGPNGSFQITA